MITLYIIGNGFDLWHDLPTKYEQFNEFAEGELSEIENYYSLDLANHGLWCDFENSLGKFDWRIFYNEHNHININSENFRPSFIYSLEDEVSEQAEQHVDGIKECFKRWVSEIDVNSANQKMVFTDNARFLTFNYTSTLQVVYGISEDKILHIHGKIGALDELLFGHGDTMDEKPEFDKYGEINRTPFSEAEDSAKYPFYALQKPVEKTLETHKTFFDSLEKTNEIVVIGHSLNKIDLPYFKKVAEKVPTAVWTLYYYTAEEKINYVKTLIKCGIPEIKLRFYSYSDLEVDRHL